MNYYNNIKNLLIDNEIYKRVKDYSKNRNDLETYYKVGECLAKAGKHYGEGIIKKYSEKLTNELGKKYNITNLKRMRQFYWLIEKGAPLGHQLTWSHYRELIPIKNILEIKYYINLCNRLSLTRDELRERIKNKEYERLDDETKLKLINKEENSIKDFVKHPIIIKNTLNKEIISEKLLQQLILENISSFMEELGEGYCFIKSEYKIKVGNTYNYIDLLLFNYKFNCFVVIELKVVPLKKDHIGQIEVYMNYIDKNIKTIYQHKTVGIIVTRKDNEYIIEYSSNPNIINTTYKLSCN